MKPQESFRICPFLMQHHFFFIVFLNNDLFEKGSLQKVIFQLKYSKEIQILLSWILWWRNTLYWTMSKSFQQFPKEKDWIKRQPSAAALCPSYHSICIKQITLQTFKIFMNHKKYKFKFPEHKVSKEHFYFVG